jgi:hypothetical protein
MDSKRTSDGSGRHNMPVQMEKPLAQRRLAHARSLGRQIEHDHFALIAIPKIISPTSASLESIACFEMQARDVHFAASDVNVCAAAGSDFERRMFIVKNRPAYTDSAPDLNSWKFTQYLDTQVDAPAI